MAIVFSVVCLVLVSGLTRGAIGENISSKALAIALLIMLGALYSLCRIIFASLRLFSGLPVIRFPDQSAGGGCRGCQGLPSTICSGVYFENLA